MRVRRAVELLAAAAVGGLGVLAFESIVQPEPRASERLTPPQRAPAAPESDVANPSAVGLLALRPDDLAAATPSRYQVVVMNAWEWERIAPLKRARPDAVILVYKDMASTRSYAVKDGEDDELLPTGIGHAEAARDHPDWFLLDERGRRVEWRGYSGHWWMDIGNRDYTDAWLESVREELRDHDWDGVLIDNAIVDTGGYLGDRRRLAAYPTDEQYQAATERFLSTVSPALRADGKTVIVNLGGATPPLDLYERWARIAGGIMREHFARGGFDGKGALYGGEAWKKQADQQDAVAAAGARFFAVTYTSPSDDAALRYARASFLLGWDGDQRSVLVVTSPEPKTDPWSDVWTVDIGKPIEARRAAGVAWLRRFEKGIAVVNPGDGDAAIDLGGAYVIDGKQVTSVNLASRSGLVLRVP